MTRDQLRVAVVVGVGVPLIAAGAVAVFLQVRASRPGPVVAETNVAFGRPFTVEWVADGQPARAWVDFECERCNFPFSGSAIVEANGVRVAAVPIELWMGQGQATSSVEAGGYNSLTGKLLFDVPAIPAGNRARVTGVMNNGTVTVVWSSGPPTPQPPPSFTKFRFYVTR